LIVKIRCSQNFEKVTTWQPTGNRLFLGLTAG